MRSSEIAKVRALARALVKAPRHRFPKTGRQLACPAKHGVYVIVSRAGRVAHVGRTTRTHGGLLDRLRAHLDGKSSFVVTNMKGERSMLRRGYSYGWVVVTNPRHRALTEALVTGMLCPRHVGTGAVAF